MKKCHHRIIIVLLNKKVLNGIVENRYCLLGPIESFIPLKSQSKAFKNQRRWIINLFIKSQF